MNQTTTSNGIGKSNNTRSIISVLLLIFIYPIGLIFMWIWSKWPLWLKIVLSLPILIVIAVTHQFYNNYTTTLKTINPSKQFSHANNTMRKNSTQQILYAVSAYRAKTGTLPKGIVSEPKEISTSGADICDEIVPVFIPDMLVDPLINNGQPVTDCSNTYTTGYNISVDVDGKITVSAPKAELNEIISITQ